MNRDALSTDLYEVTMMAGYHAASMAAPATFELYARDLPPGRSFLVAAGLDLALEYLETVRFSSDDIAFLRELPALQRAPRSFFDEYLPAFRFSGEVWAIDEGTPIFPPTPLLRVTAPLPEAQFVETALLTYLSFQTSVASRAARMIEAAAGRPVVEFGSRRAHSLEAGRFAARAAFLAGCTSTSNVEAGRRFGIPVAGTMAHSWVTAFPDELAAFRRFTDVFGQDAVLLLDTYDTLAATRAVAASGLRPRGVRLDSGDFVSLSRQVRDVLDAHGLRETTIFVSGDLDEWRIADIVAAGAPVDGFGVGTALSTSSDAPSLGAIYKLVEIERDGRTIPIMKLSTAKSTWPGRKQVWRCFDGDQATGDVIGLADEPEARGSQPLLRKVMENGRRLTPSIPASAIRERCRHALHQLPELVRRLRNPARYPVRFSDELDALTQRLSKAPRI